MKKTIFVNCVKWLKEETHIQKVVSLNPSTGYWMNIFPHLFVVKFGLFVWKRQKINEKEAEDEPFKTLLNTVLKIVAIDVKFLATAKE